MPNSNQYKLLRSGNVRRNGGYGSRGKSRSGGYGVSEDTLVPKIEELGHSSFSKLELQALTERLRDPQWPRDTLNIYGLEGLLTAMLVLPLGLRPGSWLPLIWHETGWKIPATLQGKDQFDSFIESIVGYMRAIDNGLLETPPRFDSALDLPLAKREHSKTLSAHQYWVRGFGLAISHSNYLNVPPDTITHRALYVIAKYATPPSIDIEQHIQTPRTLQQAVLVLTKTRTSRGPLGLLPMKSKAAAIAPINMKARDTFCAASARPLITHHEAK